MLVRKRDFEILKSKIAVLWRKVGDMEQKEKNRETFCTNIVPVYETQTWTGCNNCKAMDAAMRVMLALQFSRSNGTEAMGVEYNFRSALAFNKCTKEIIINEEELMQAIIFANPGQKRRKLRLVSEEEFEQYKKRQRSKEPPC